MIPTLIFADLKTGMTFEASSIILSVSSERPVVHITTGSFFATAYSMTAGTAFAVEKSISTSAAVSQSFIFV